ncbi:hypothetical protein BA950_05920 [Erythrobacter sp. SAORIC-644]|uniref:hypothetical protein n=1 Tax=Erythrobacter sp. SAORIC-644 TaxID=1869314 RepID=UPI000C9FBA1E|nr:hypothetical protein [Erythrobacter sp. SAORIC-644]PNQ76999.1 hypothetical protein BA950_05920 [Erythrobacter sp. SAORIC-644]
MPSIKSISVAPALLAVVSMTAMPAQAAELPQVGPVHVAQAISPAWAPGDDTADQYRRYRHRRHRGVDAGDVIAGVLILGGIAAVASAASSSRDRNPRYPDPQRGDYHNDDTRGLDRAVSICVDEIERNARIQTVDAVNRNARGWSVTGSMYDGQSFSCVIGGNGRIDAIDYGRGGDTYGNGYSDGGYGYEANNGIDDRQYSDDYYAAARARTESAVPAYPGGPLPGEEDQSYGAADIEYGDGYQGAGN